MRRAIGYVLIFLTAPLMFSQELPEDAELELPAELPSELDIEELRRRITGEAPNEIMSYSLGDTNVSLFLTGSWYGDLQTNFGFFVSPILGTGFISPETPLLFKQEVDLTMALWIKEKWFVEATFLDDSSQNTYRAGYQGKPGEFIQYAGIGNTGLDFPSFPYLDLGGDSPSSFGFYGRVGNDKFNVHTLIRYDAASREERTFSGGRERTYSDVAPQNSIRGISFVLPDTNIESDITVYIEDEKGEIRDNSGRRWRLALNSEFAFSRLMGILELSIRPIGLVAVKYEKNGMHEPWENSMGTYRTQGSFLNEVQNWFDPGINKIILENLPQPGRGNLKPGKININGINALVIYEPGTFSPFERRNRYDAPSSTSEKAALVRQSAGTEISGFELVQLQVTSVPDLFLHEAVENQLSVYELVQPSVSDQRDPVNRWPLASEIPEIYLPGYGIYTGDTVLRFTNYSSINGYFIGTNVIPGSVQVFRSGIPDSKFAYNASTGEVIINDSTGQNEIIRISYLKTNEGLSYGSIAAGIGAIYKNRNSPFSAQAALGIRMNVSDDAYTEENQSSAGVVGISAKTAWDYDYLKAQITAGFAFVQTDTTGLYRASGMEGNEIIIPLPADSSFISNQCYVCETFYASTNTRANLIFRNYYNNTVLGNNLMQIDWSGGTVVSGVNRPYQVKDSQLGDAHVITAEFKLDSETNWTGFQVPLGVNGEIISRAGEIEIPFRLYDFSGDMSNFKLIVQIGSLSGKDFYFAENNNLIWEQELLAENWIYGEGARSLRFKINEADRQKLSDAKYLRIIALYSGNDNEVSGRVLIAPLIIRGSSFRAITYDTRGVNGIADSVTVTETIEIGANSLESAHGSLVDRLHPTSGTQRVLKIEWDNLTAGVNAGADRRISELPLSDYRELSFFAKGPYPENKNGILRFIAAAGPDSIDKPYLEGKIPLSALSSEQWKKVTIRYNGKETGIKVDGVNIDTAAPVYNKLRTLNENEIGTSYIAFLVEPDGAALSDGSIFIDEIILEDAVLAYRMNTGAAIEYSKPGTIVSAWGYPLLADFSIYTSLESEGRTESEAFGSSFTASAANRSGLDISILNTDISGNISFVASEDDFLWSADHSISKSIGAFSVKEAFSASPQTNAARHTFNMAFLSNFYAKFLADAVYDLSRLNQIWNFGIGYNPKIEYIPSLEFNTNAAWTSIDEINEHENYGDLWVRTWEPLVPDKGYGALARKTNSQFILTQRTKPVGAIITLDGITNFFGSNSTMRLENSGYLDVPVFFEKFNFNLRAGRGFKRQHFYYSEDVIDDGSKLKESIEECLPLWGVFPGYSLFADELSDEMNKIDFAQYSAFNDHFSLRLNLPNIYNFSAFLIPSKITYRMERVMEHKMETKTDTLNIGGSLGFSAINMFGAMGYSPIFKFYQSDEFSHGIEAALIIPKDEERIWRISSVLSANFIGFSGSLLTYTNNFALRKDYFWTENFVLNWEVPTQKNLLSFFYNWIVKAAETQKSWLNLTGIFNINYEQLRRESLEIIFDKSSDYLKWSIIAGHEEIVRILGRLNLTTFAKLRFSEDLYTDVFTVDALLGITLRVSF